MKRSLLLMTITLVCIGVVTVLYLVGFLNPIITSIFPNNPTADSAEWTLVVDGSVQHPLKLTLNELMAMPKTTVNAAIYCVGPPSSLVTSGNWTGVRLGLILEKAGVSSGAVKIAFYATDNYSTDLTVQTAMSNNIIVAYEKDGVPLTEKLRLVVPGKWGYKWISNLNHIEVTNYNFLGKWESRGYSDDGNISG
jgi:DMSO/TMAO reductase YedYZ molybdopterin-dependent catalytic subunit